MNIIEAFEMWCYRRLLRIPWTAKESNAEVLIKIGKERELLNIIKIRKMLYLGHPIRNSKDITTNNNHGKSGKENEKLFGNLSLG